MSPEASRHRTLDEDEYGEVIPVARCHHIELDWNGKRYRFRVDFDDDSVPYGDISLSCVYGIDPKHDEWVKAPHSILEAATNDPELMGQLFRYVNALEEEADVMSGQDTEFSDEV